MIDNSLSNNRPGSGRLQQEQLKDQQQGLQDQETPFGGQNHDKRVFKVLPLTAENVSYQVSVTEGREGDISTEHINSKHLSAGREINSNTPVCQCERCKEINVSSVFQICKYCGKNICPKCKKTFQKRSYCRRSCFFIAVALWLIKLLFTIVFQIIVFIVRFVLKVVSLPVKDVLWR